MRKEFADKFKESLSGNYITLTIIGINIIIYIALNMFPNLSNQLLIYDDMVIKKPWTLITVFFSHIIHVHLLLNMILFFIFGTKLEKLTSSKVVLFTYIICGFAGSLTIVPVATFLAGTKGAAAGVSGASAAVFGVVAAFCAMQPNVIILKSKAKTWLIVLFVANAAITILNPQTAIGGVAHVIGILVGLFSGFLFKKKYMDNYPA